MQIRTIVIKDSYGDVYTTSTTSDEQLECTLEELRDYYVTRARAGRGYSLETRDATWVEAASYMMADGHWKSPPWVGHQLWQRHFPVWDTQYVHVSVDDPTMIAFYPSKDHGEAGRKPVKMKPGKYLAKYFAANDKTGVIADGKYKGQIGIFTKKQVAYFAEWFANGEEPGPDDIEPTVQFATTADEIAEVYSSGPESCMDARHFSNPDHMPVRAYAAGDLAVAFMRNTSGQVIARALCWPDREVFGRVYPSEGVAAYAGHDGENSKAIQLYMRAQLKKMGWTDVAEDSTVFNGARIAMIPYSRATGSHTSPGPNVFAVPYLDSGYSLNLSDDETHFVMDRNGDIGSSQYGYAKVTLRVLCPHCETKKSPVDGYGDSVFFDVAVSVTETGEMETQKWCPDCRRRGVYHCDGYNMYMMRSVFPKQTDAYGNYSARYYAENDGYICGVTGGQRFGTIHPKIMFDGRPCAQQDVWQSAFYCKYDDTYYGWSDMSYKHPGFPAKYDSDETITAEQRLESDFTRRVQVFNRLTRRWDTPDGSMNPVLNDRLCTGWSQRMARYDLDQAERERQNALQRARRAARKAEREAANEVPLDTGMTDAELLEELGVPVVHPRAWFVTNGGR